MQSIIWLFSADRTELKPASRIAVPDLPLAAVILSENSSRLGLTGARVPLSRPSDETRWAQSHPEGSPRS